MCTTFPLRKKNSFCAVPRWNRSFPDSRRLVIWWKIFGMISRDIVPE
jgi:hypothetical protein